MNKYFQSYVCIYIKKEFILANEEQKEEVANSAQIINVSGLKIFKFFLFNIVFII